MHPPADEFDTHIRPEEIDPDRPRPIATPYGEMSLYLVGDEILAAQSFCPHMGGPLFQGTRSGETQTCPWHLWTFSLRSGERIDGQPGGTGDERLLVCLVRVGPAGTLILSAPRASR